MPERHKVPEAQFGFSALLHGSRADRTAVRFSDVDLVILLWPDAVRHPGQWENLERQLRRLVRYTIELDPLQHHLPTIIDGRRFEASIPFMTFPPLFVEDLLLVAGTIPSLPVASVVGPESGESTGQLAATVAMVRGLAQLDPRRAHVAKGLISAVLLLPVAYLQAQGRSVSKRAALGMYRDMPFAELVRQAEWLRRSWEYEGESLARSVRLGTPFFAGEAALRRLPLVRPVRELHQALLVFAASCRRLAVPIS